MSVEDRIRKIVEGYCAPEDKITSGTRFVEDLGLDSLDEVEVVMDCEREFSIQIADEEAEEIKTFGALVVAVESKIGNHKSDTP